jgi:protein SCO1/2
VDPERVIPYLRKGVFGPSFQKRQDPRDVVKQHLLARIFRLLTGVLLGLAVVIGLFRLGSPGQGTDPGQYFLSAPLPAPLFTLTSHWGDPVSSLDFPDKILAVFFGYTFCPDVCPLALSHLSQAFMEMGEEGERIQLLFISVDPGRDTPKRLGQYLGAFHTSFLGLTGSEEEIREVADAFGAVFARRGEGAEYTVDHTARMFIIHPSGRMPLTFPVMATPREMARDLTLLLEEIE